MIKLSVYTVIRDINKARSMLIKEYEKKGLYENFGQKEISNLRSKYFDVIYKIPTVANHIQSFNEWCMSYNGGYKCLK